MKSGINPAIIMSLPLLPLASLLLLLCLIVCILLKALSSSTAVAAAAAANNDKKLPLPPGSMGWPYIGETFHLYTSRNPNIFFALKQKRYGSIFKTHILGCPCVMVSSPEAARFVLVTHAHLFKPTYPASKERMLGPQAIFFQQGRYHALLRRLVLRAVMPDAIRDSVAAIEAVATRTLASWEGGRIVNTFQEMKTYAFNVALLSIFGKEEICYIEEMKRCYYALEKGYNSMPVNLPGSPFSKAMKARKRLADIVVNIISSRRRRRTRTQGIGAAEHLEGSCDLLASFMETNEALTDAQIVDNIVGVIFAARDTTASVLTWIVKFLAENPTVLNAVTEEQEDIMKSRGEAKEGEKCLTWGDTRRMPMTSRVIQETMRVASILSFTFREAVEDVEFEGYLIPKGWKVMPLFRNIHHSPDNFPDPEKFDPSRFELMHIYSMHATAQAAPKAHTFMPFGNGTHSCPGNELAKLEMLVLLHHLTTKYTWSIFGSDAGTQFGPFVLPFN
ncbi:Abscisic acid 8'-hydroxylase 1, partial [Ananas comosus]